MEAQAPTPSLLEYTAEQRWGRLASLDLSWIASEVALGKSRGMTIDEIGKFLGGYFADSWAGGLDARSLLTSFRWNFLSHPNSRVEVIHLSDSLVTARLNTPVLGAFGPDRLYYALSLDEYRTLFQHINRSIAERVGVVLEQRYDGDWLVVTMRNGTSCPSQRRSCAGSARPSSTSSTRSVLHRPPVGERVVRQHGADHHGQLEGRVGTEVAGAGRRGWGQAGFSG